MNFNELKKDTVWTSVETLSQKLSAGFNCRMPGFPSDIRAEHPPNANRKVVTLFGEVTGCSLNERNECVSGKGELWCAVVSPQPVSRPGSVPTSLTVASRHKFCQQGGSELS
jgi:hypothetical protein